MIQQPPAMHAMIIPAISPEANLLDFFFFLEPRGRTSTVGVAVGAGIGIGRIEAAFGGAWFLARTSERPSDPAQEAAIDLGLGYLEGCYRLGREPWFVPLCAGVELGVHRVRGQGSTPLAQRATGVWVAPRLGAGLRWQASSRVAPALTLDLAVPVLRHDFGIQGEDVFRSPPVVAGLSLGADFVLN